MDTTQQKLALVLSPSGPVMSSVWQEGTFSIKKRTQKINELLKGSAVHSVTETMVTQWHKGQVKDPARATSLLSLCELIRIQTGLRLVPSDLVGDIVSFDEFAKKMNIDYLQARRLVMSFTLNMEHWESAFTDLRPARQFSGKDPSYGVYRLDRFDPKKPKKKTSTCVLVIGDQVVWHGAKLAAPYAALLVPTGNKSAPIVMYSGVMARCEAAMYMTLKSWPNSGYLNDMCFIIVEPAKGAVHNVLEGVYSSSNIEGGNAPSSRLVKAERIKDDVPENAFEELSKICVLQK